VGNIHKFIASLLVLAIFAVLALGSEDLDEDEQKRVQEIYEELTDPEGAMKTVGKIGAGGTKYVVKPVMYIADGVTLYIAIKGCVATGGIACVKTLGWWGTKVVTLSVTVAGIEDQYKRWEENPTCTDYKVLANMPETVEIMEPLDSSAYATAKAQHLNRLSEQEQILPLLLDSYSRMQEAADARDTEHALKQAKATNHFIEALKENLMAQKELVHIQKMEFENYLLYEIDKDFSEAVDLDYNQALNGLKDISEEGFDDQERMLLEEAGLSSAEIEKLEAFLMDPPDWSEWDDGSLEALKAGMDKRLELIDKELTELKEASRQFNELFEIVDPVEKSFLYWQHDDGRLKTWHMEGSEQVNTSPLVPGNVNPAWQVKAVVDMSGNGHPDIYFYNQSEGLVKVWLMEGLNKTGQVVINNPHKERNDLDPAWDMMAVYDLNDSGEPDIIWQRNDGQLAIWLMENQEAARTGRLYNHPGQSAVNPDWKIGAVTDLLGDGRPEVLWQAVEGDFEDELAFWKVDIDRENFFRSESGRLTQKDGRAEIKSWWRMKTAVDLLGNGKPELLFHGISGDFKGRVSFWEMEKAEMIDAARLSPERVEDPLWQLVGSSD